MTGNKNKLYNIFENTKEPQSRLFWLEKKAILIFKNLAFGHIYTTKCKIDS